MNAPLTLDRLLPELDHGHLDWLEEEATFILRETAVAFERPADAIPSAEHQVCGPEQLAGKRSHDFFAPLDQLHGGGGISGAVCHLGQHHPRLRAGGGMGARKGSDPL